ncbi:MAG: esterase [Bacteroidota bacterium]
MQDKMNSEKRVSYTTQNTYSTFGHYSSKTKNIWLVFHGMGHLSRYFMWHFNSLNPEENYVIAPQAPSKYYQGTDYKHVGASWLTREDTVEETKNVLQYVDAVWKAEKPTSMTRLIVVGYSQGVSIATRWLASRKMVCDHLVLHSGGIPNELRETDFQYLPQTAKVTFLYGNEDPYITPERLKEETKKGRFLFGDRLNITVFNGAHEVHRPFFAELS